MGDLRDWLRRNKLEQYADTFEANDIDLDIVPELTEADLENLGISLGNRRRLMKAFAERTIDARGSVPQPAAEFFRRSRAAPGHRAVLRFGRVHRAVPGSRS